MSTQNIIGEVDAGTIDPLLAAIRQAIVSAGKDGEVPDGWTPALWAALKDLGEKQVVIVPPEETAAGIDSAIKTAMGRTTGLCLLLVTGSGKNPDPDAPGPLMTLALEAQLFVNTVMRSKSATPPMLLLQAVAKLLHLATIRTNGWDAYEKIKYTGHEPLPDPDFTAFAISFDREITI